MNSIALITSVIDTPNTPLSYTNCRSVFNKEERFEHTKNTILSLRKKIPNTKIFLVECSNLSQDYQTYFQKNVDYFINIYDTGDSNLINRMFTPSKSMGEGTMTIFALNFLFENSIDFDCLFKISGRYWLNDNFNYDLYNNNFSCVHRIHNNKDNIFTCFYKLSRTASNKWLLYLLNADEDFVKCIGYEIMFANFLKIIEEEIHLVENKVGINGYVTVCGSFIDM